VCKLISASCVFFFCADPTTTPTRGVYLPRCCVSDSVTWPSCCCCCCYCRMYYIGAAHSSHSLDVYPLLLPLCCRPIGCMIADFSSRRSPNRLWRVHLTLFFMQTMPALFPPQKCSVGAHDTAWTNRRNQTERKTAKTWADNIQEDCSETGLTSAVADRLASD